MKVKSFRFVALLFVLLFSFAAVFGCSPAAEEPEEPAEENGEAVDEEETEEPLSVAMMLPGPISDEGWNATAYQGLMMIEEELGSEVSFTEQVELSDIPEIVRGYANQGYDVIIGHGFQFGDPVADIHEDFPEIKFVITSSDINIEPNVASLNNDNWQQGFLAGSFSALMTESGKVGKVAGMEIPSIIGSVQGYEEGVRFINETEGRDVEYITQYTGDFYDAVAAKELAQAMINEGADIVAHNADAAGLGVFEAARDNEGILAVGAISDQHNRAPEVVVTSALGNLSEGIFEFVSGLNSGEIEFEAREYKMGIEQGVVGLAPFHDFEDEVPEEVKERMDEIIGMLLDEEIEMGQY